jgi:hypothetical protein
MAQVGQAAQVHQVAVILRAFPVPVILQAAQTAVDRRVSRRAVIPAVTQPLLRQWEDTQSPIVLFIQTPFEAGLNRFPIFVILALATGTAIGRQAKITWIGRATIGAGCLVLSGSDFEWGCGRDPENTARHPATRLLLTLGV